MGLTGLFLITFLVVHCFINAMVFFDSSGQLFNEYAHFMGTNILIRIMEIGLFAGLLLHIVDGLMLYAQNRAVRPQKYVFNNPNANSKWYSRSMALLGTLLLIFLILHLAHFWVKSRGIIGNLPEVEHPAFKGNMIDLYAEMRAVFSSVYVVAIYVLAQVALAYHLLHGFKSAFQSLGLNHIKYNGIIAVSGQVFSVLVPLIFALMPIVIYLRH